MILVFFPVFLIIFFSFHETFQLGTVSLALFRTLISFYCEDVMLQLVLKWVALMQTYTYKHGLTKKDVMWFTTRWAFYSRPPAAVTRLLPPPLGRHSPSTTHWFSWHASPSASAGTWSPATTWCWVRGAWWGRGTSTRLRRPRFWLWRRPAALLITAPRPSDSWTPSSFLRGGWSLPATPAAKVMRCKIRTCFCWIFF